MSEFDWSQYLIGGATRPDAISGLDPRMQNALRSFMVAAPEGLQIYSAYRSPELQAQLYENALAKYGSPEAARKWVAPPGSSQHNHGRAADLKYDGTRLDQAPEWVREWVRENAGAYGLDVPMEWEPWQVELAGARGMPARSASAPQVTRTPAPQEPVRNAFAMYGEPERRQPPQLAMLDANAFMSRRRFA